MGQKYEDIDDCQQYIYVVLSSTTTRMGKMIQRITKYRYNHLSLSMERNISKLYSFARYYYKSPLVGGFVEESICRYCYKSKGDINVKVCQIPVSKQQYNQIQNDIKYLKSHETQYMYNTISAIYHTFGKTKKIKHAYTCVEFVGHILRHCYIEDGIDVTRVYSIQKMDELISKYVIYEGNILGIAGTIEWGNDQYLTPVSSMRVIGSTVRHFIQLIHRMISTD